MDKRYQVFISSTYSDLEEERRHVMQVLLELDAIPSGMELFPAANEEQWELIKKVIDDSDYYLVILAGRYGSIGPEGISYTEMEYRYALNKNKPIISFIHKDPTSLPQKFCETTDTNREKLQIFYELVKKKHCKMWTSPLDLSMKVGVSFARLIQSCPSTGWVRANKLENEQTVREIFRLKEYIKELEDKISYMESISSFELEKNLKNAEYTNYAHKNNLDLNHEATSLNAKNTLLNTVTPQEQSIKPKKTPPCLVKHNNVKITLIGVGGGGCNALNQMATTLPANVKLVGANTDRNSLDRMTINNKIQLGNSLTFGLGTGGELKIGYEAAKASIDKIRKSLTGSDVVFIAAGMGGGTGSGAASIIAEVAKEVGALTVAIVTKPFFFEGKKRLAVAEDGIKKLSQHADALIVIPNDHLLQMAKQKATFVEMLELADQVIFQTVKGISNLLDNQGIIYLDLDDIQSVLSQSGEATVGIGSSSGESSASKAAIRAITSPLVDSKLLESARSILLNISCHSDVTLDEISEVAGLIQESVNKEASVFFGTTFDDNLKDEITVTIVATQSAPKPQHSSALRSRGNQQ